MSLRAEELRHLARLARLELSPNEEKLLGEQLARIIEFVGRIAEVETELIDSSVVEHSAVGEADDIGAFAVDDPAERLRLGDRLLANAPDRLDRFVLIPRIVGHRDP